MKVIFPDNNQKWNKFLFENKGSFLQSFEWGEFQKSLGKKVWRLEAREGGEIFAQAQVIKEDFSFGKSHFYIPFGPCFKREDSLEVIFKEIQELAKKENSVFLRIESFAKITIPKEFLFKTVETRIQPQKTLLLNLEESEEEIFENFSSGTRYNIRLSEKKDVKIRFEDEYIPEFYKLIKKTSIRHSFTPFDEKHYISLFNVKNNDFKVKMCIAEHQGKIIGTYILVLFNKIAFSLHGATNRDYRALKVSNLLQWEKIKLAKRMGCEKFDFWGIDKEKWPGLTAFKQGFNGQELQYPATNEIIFQKFWYKLYCFLKRLK
ncbi:MAG: peptidoglycan bridge formation glycyltransferase FemA/FemB family protein [Patescibacteria group bacterium]|nr:peptidoglycan bridge formation glycyltransferase FemA/FemB family protein [Patescibacteria group bacterium]